MFRRPAILGWPGPYRSSRMPVVAVAVPSVAFFFGWCAYLDWATGDPFVFWSAKDAWIELSLPSLLADPLEDPFAEEVVAAPAKGVERWLAQRLSHRLGATPSGPGEARSDGVCAGVRFLTPHSLVALVLGEFHEHLEVVEASLHVGDALELGLPMAERTRHLLRFVDVVPEVGAAACSLSCATSARRASMSTTSVMDE